MQINKPSIEAILITTFFIIKIVIHLLNPEYGYFRDELYYASVADQFSFSNLDVQPLTPLYIKMITSILGFSLKALHFASALCGAIALVISCFIAKELGGGKYAILLTGITVLLSGFLIFGAFITYDSIDFLIQVSAIYLLIKIIKFNQPKYWIILGLILGLGLFNKLSVLAFGFALFCVLWFTPYRKFYKEKWIWISALIALAFLIPTIVWQWTHDWYYIDFVQTYSGGTAYVPSFLEFLWQQILPNNIFGLPIWLTGLFLLLFREKWKEYRLFGLMYVLMFTIYFFFGIKFYFLIPMYTVLYAVGAIKVEELFDKLDVTKFKTKLMRAGLPAVYVLLSLPLLPMTMPILPVEHFVKFASLMGTNAGVQTENHEISNLPHHMADRFGWYELTDLTDSLYNTYYDSLNADLGIFTENYGQASAIFILGRDRGLPKPISMHGWFYFDAKMNHDFQNNYVAVGISENDLKQVFRNVKQIGLFTHPYCIPYANNTRIFICTNPKYDLKQYWQISRKIDESFIEILNLKGVEAAINYYHSINLTNPNRLLFTEAQINVLGYQYLGQNKIEDAIRLFEFNVELFPDSWNVYDSLGEALMNNGQLGDALINYHKSIELNNWNENGIKMIEKINSRIKN